MRYIKKGDTPSIMTEWIALRKQANQPVVYDEFDKKGELNEILRKEQHSLCCYCQRPVTHYQNPKQGGSHNEHLYPENRPDDSLSLEKQMDFSNLFACCIDSAGHKKREKHLQYCGEAKGNQIIRGFIKESNCAHYFRYTINGEIIPNGEYGTWNEYQDNAIPAGDINDAKMCIQILNLNSPTLVDDRKKCVDILVKYLMTNSEYSVQQVVHKWFSSDDYPPYIELRLQYIRKKFPHIKI